MVSLSHMPHGAGIFTYIYPQKWLSFVGKYSTPMVRRRVFEQPWNQWPFQQPKLELPTIYEAYFLGLNFREYPKKILPYMVQYLHFRILKFPLMKRWPLRSAFPRETTRPPASSATRRCGVAWCPKAPVPWCLGLVKEHNDVTISGWWFQPFTFHNVWDNRSHWLSYFSEVLKPPTR